eukprot:TRINITY_DN5949_c0_g1_i1.p1 TRINITY_DN5949_c0_g1~~TRINITY_DN5949_c0_g1_i1.p1  ORF type:complete len:575 (-),score=61.72 TRINITY_DN5949_c0_g1_i1:45-1736(-)
MDFFYNNALVFGAVGTGKTTILNLLTGHQFQTASSGYSCTRELQKAICEYRPFRVLDFPGTDAAKDVVKHVQIQAAALKANHFRVICLVHKMTDRFDDIMHRLSKVFRLFRHHVRNIVVILTHCDLFSIKQRAEAVYVIQNTFKVDHVFEKHMRTTGEELAAWIYSFIEPNEKQTKAGIKAFETVHEGEGLFETDNFANLICDTEIDASVIDSRDALRNKFQGIYAQHVAEFRRTQEPELKRALYFSLKNYMDAISEEHAAFVAPLFVDKWEFNAELIIFQNSLMAVYKPFKTMVVEEIKVETVVYDTRETATYRQCPHCGLIWLRIYGCDSITCGKRSLSRDTSNRTFYNYTIKYVSNVLDIVCNSATSSMLTRFQEQGEVFGLTATEKEQNAAREQREVALIKPQGCGQTMEWRDMLDKTKEVEELLREFDFSHHSETQNIVKRHEGEVSVLPQATFTSSSKRTANSSISHSGTASPKRASAQRQPGPTNGGEDVTSWSVKDVLSWLDTIGMGSAKACFEAEGITGAALLDLSDSDLRELGIAKMGERKAFNAAVNVLKDQ